MPKQVGKGREREKINKNRSNGFRPDPKQKIPKKQQKNSKNQKTPLQLVFKPKYVGKGRERDKIRKIVPLCSYPTRNRKFQKKAKNLKKLEKIGRAHV